MKIELLAPIANDIIIEMRELKTIADDRIDEIGNLGECGYRIDKAIYKDISDKVENIIALTVHLKNELNNESK